MDVNMITSQGIYYHQERNAFKLQQLVSTAVNGMPFPVREKQNATTQFVKTKTRRRSSQKTKRDDAVREKQNATTQFVKTKRDDAVREKQNATTQFAKNKTRRRSSRKAKRDDAVREKQSATRCSHA